MTSRIWVKLYLEILDYPKMGRLVNHLWRRAVELFLLAGRGGNDGALLPEEEMAWSKRNTAFSDLSQRSADRKPALFFHRCRTEIAHVLLVYTSKAWQFVDGGSTEPFAHLGQEKGAQDRVAHETAQSLRRYL